MAVSTVSKTDRAWLVGKSAIMAEPGDRVRMWEIEMEGSWIVEDIALREIQGDNVATLYIRFDGGIIPVLAKGFYITAVHD